MPSTRNTALAALAVGLLVGATVTGVALGALPPTAPDTGPDPTNPNWGYQLRPGCTEDVRGDGQQLTVDREPRGETVAVEVDGRVTYRHGRTLDVAVFYQNVRQYVVWLTPVPDRDHAPHEGGCTLASTVSVTADIDAGYHCIRVIYNGTAVETFRNETVRDPCV
jgi:hypothetical protein